MTAGPGRLRRRIRLDRESYADPRQICSVTIAVRDRKPVFARSKNAVAAVEILRRLAADYQIPVYAYCVMPDHVHLILSASASCDIISLVGQFKNLVLRSAWSQGITGAFWQRSFWDHFVRSDEDLGQLIEYVRANPVRAGLVQDSSAYEFSGSLSPPR